DPLAWERLLRGCCLLSKGCVVITDRLHGHILCLLLGIPHVLLDNNYGKVRWFYETWTRDCPLACWAASPPEALALAEAMLARRGQRPWLPARSPPEHKRPRRARSCLCP